MATGILKRTTGAEVVDRFSGAVTEDAEPRNGEVEADGIVRVQKPKRGRNLIGHPPVGCSPVRQSEESTYSGDMGVHRDDELAGPGGEPKPQIHAIGGADHPFQEEVKPLAGARAGGIGEEI